MICVAHDFQCVFYHAAINKVKILKRAPTDVEAPIIPLVETGEAPSPSYRNNPQKFVREASPRRRF